MIWVIQPFGGLIYHRALLHDRDRWPASAISAGVILAALGLGVAEQFVGFMLGAQFQIAFVFLALVVILVLRKLAAAPPAPLSGMSWRRLRRRCDAFALLALGIVAPFALPPFARSRLPRSSPSSGS